MAAVAHSKTLRLPMVVGGKTQHLEQLTHFVLIDQLHGLRTPGLARFGHFFSQP